MDSGHKSRPDVGGTGGNSDTSGTWYAVASALLTREGVEPGSGHHERGWPLQ